MLEERSALQVQKRGTSHATTRGIRIHGESEQRRWHVSMTQGDVHSFILLRRESCGPERHMCKQGSTRVNENG